MHGTKGSKLMAFAGLKKSKNITFLKGERNTWHTKALQDLSQVFEMGELSRQRLREVLPRPSVTQRNRRAGVDNNQTGKSWHRAVFLWDSKVKEGLYRTSLAAQWLRLHASTAGGLGSISGQELRSHMPSGWCSQKTDRDFTLWKMLQVSKQGVGWTQQHN